MRALAWLSLLLGVACAREGDVVVVCFGDSTTLWRGPELNWTALVEEELSSPQRAVRLVNAGQSSDDTDLARRRFAWDVLRHRPDLVTIQFGINDAMVDVDEGSSKPRVPLDRYVENLRSFARWVRRLGGEPVLLTPNPLRWEPWLRERYGKAPYRPNEDRGLNVVLEDYVAAIRGLAEAEGIVLVDLYRAYEESERSGGPPVRELLMDGMHPNDSGHRLVARRVGPALEAALARQRGEAERSSAASP